MPRNFEECQDIWKCQGAKWQHCSERRDTTRCFTLLSSMSSKSCMLSSSLSSHGGGSSAHPGIVLQWYGSSSLTGNTLCFHPLYIFLQIQLICSWT